MTGKLGQCSEKPTMVPKKFSEGFLESMDGRVCVVRALKRRYAALSRDLGSDLSYQQDSLAQRAIHLEARIEAMEKDLLDGKSINFGQYLNCINSLIGLLKTLGIKRRSKDVCLRDYIDGSSK